MSQKTSKKKDNRFRLNAEEISLIEKYRETGTLPDSLQVKSDINKTNLISKHQDLKKRYETCLSELTETQKQLEALINLRNTAANPYKIAPTNVKKNSESTMVIVASDWHLEESIDPSTVNGLNEFNLQIAEERANTFFQKSLLMYNLVGKSFNIRNCVLALLGDFINGYIHEEFVEENNLSPTQTLLLAKKILISGIDFLLEKADFDEIVVPCSIGNHGRTTLKSRVSSAYKNSFEWLLYKDLEFHYQNNKKVKFIVSNSYHTFLNLYDKYLIRFHHGDAIRYSGGVGGLSVPVNKAIAQWNKSIPAYLDVFGHWHQSLEGGNFISNGSLVGFNSYATFIKASYEIPQQSMFIINEQNGKIMSAPIFLTDDKR